MRILVACEYSGTVRNAFRKLGHDAWSCDILPTDADPKYHYQCDIFEVINEGWDMMIANFIDEGNMICELTGNVVADADGVEINITPCRYYKEDIIPVLQNIEIQLPF